MLHFGVKYYALMRNNYSMKTVCDTSRENKKSILCNPKIPSNQSNMFLEINDLGCFPYWGRVHYIIDSAINIKDESLKYILQQRDMTMVWNSNWKCCENEKVVRGNLKAF